MAFRPSKKQPSEEINAVPKRFQVSISNPCNPSKYLGSLKEKKTMKHLLLVLALFCGIQTTQAQKIINLESFQKILIKGNLEVKLIQGDQPSLRIERGEDHRVSYEFQNGQLIIKHSELFKYKSYRDFPIQVELTYSELNKIDVRAGAKVRANESIAGIRLDIHLGSGAQLKADIQTEKVDVDVAEGAVADLTGRVKRFTGIAASGGRMEAFDVDSEDTRVRANTGGVVEVTAFKSLDAQAHTGGEISYRGKPDQLVINDNLGGSVKRY